MIQHAHKKAILIEDRIINMKVMEYCLKRYQETKQEEFWEWAKIFGDWSKNYKKQIEELK